MGFFDSRTSGNVVYDTKDRTFKLTKAFHIFTTGTRGPFPYDALVDYQLIQNGGAETHKETSIRHAIRGKALFGTAGAVVGGLTGKETTNPTITQLEVHVTVNKKGSLENYIIRYVTTPTLAKYCTTAVENAHDTISALNYIKSEAQKNEASDFVPASGGSSVDDLKKLKDLLDSGAITQDEYNKMKKRIIGI